MTTAATETNETGAAGAGANDFDKLLGEITDFSKAFDEKKVDKKKNKEGKEGKEGDERIAEAAEGDDEPGEEMGKSFDIKLDDGTVVKAFDGGPMFKALADRAERAETALASLFGVVKSLVSDVETLSAAPRGRKTVLSIADRGATAARTDEVSKGGEEISGTEFMAKAMAAYTAGRIGGATLTKLENQIGRGMQPDAEAVRVVLQK